MELWRAGIVKVWGRGQMLNYTKTLTREKSGPTLTREESGPTLTREESSPTLTREESGPTLTREESGQWKREKPDLPVGSQRHRKNLQHRKHKGART